MRTVRQPEDFGTIEETPGAWDILTGEEFLGALTSHPLFMTSMGILVVLVILFVIAFMSRSQEQSLHGLNYFIAPGVLAVAIMFPIAILQSLPNG